MDGGTVGVHGFCFVEPLKDYLIVNAIAKNGRVKKSSSRFRSVNQCQNGVVRYPKRKPFENLC